MKLNKLNKLTTTVIIINKMGGKFRLIPKQSKKKKR